MMVLNFSHPLTAEHLAQVEAFSGQAIERVIDAPARFDHAQPFAAQVTALVEGLGLSPAEWQTLPLLINPPSLHVIAVTVLAEIINLPAVRELKQFLQTRRVELLVSGCRV